MKKYLDMTKTEYELIIKLVLCTILATLATGLMGEPYSPTTAVTANLFLYCDRGYRGSLRYGARRVMAQVVQGLLVLGIIFPCKYLMLPIPDIVLVMTACCLALCIGLPINYKHTYAPLNCTLANATFVIACATVQNLEAFPKRVLQCVVGAVIGYFVNFIVFSYKDREKEISKLTSLCIHDLLESRDLNAYRKHMGLMDKEFGFLMEDNAKNPNRAELSREKMDYLLGNQKLLIALDGFVETYENYKEKLSDEYRECIESIFWDAANVHKSMLSSEKSVYGIAENFKLQSLETKKSEELCVLGRLLEYEEQIIQLADSRSFG